MAEIKERKTGDEPAEKPAPTAPGQEGQPLAGQLVTGGRSGSIIRAMLLPFLAIITALAVGAIIIIFTNQAALDAWGTFFADPLGALRASWDAMYQAYSALFVGAFGSATALSETITNTTPLILAGLSVALGFRAGLFNIGAEGQISVGAICGAALGFSFPGLSVWMHVALVVIGACLGGALWGFIPGLLKARTGAHEVITTIMLNYVSFSLVAYVLSDTGAVGKFYRPPGANDPVARPVLSAFPHLFGSSYRANVGIILAILVAIGVGWLVNRTTVGFEFRAVGANPAAARAAGMSPGRTYMTVLSLAGGIAGLAAATQLLGPTASLTPGFSSGYGFDAIAIALLGRASSLGVVLAAVLFGAMHAGSRPMQAVAGTPVDIITVIQALMVLFVAAPALIRALYRIKARGVAGPEVFTKGWGG